MELLKLCRSIDVVILAMGSDEKIIRDEEKEARKKLSKPHSLIYNRFMEELYIGLMSGTSVDSVNSVLVNLANQRVQILAKISTNIPKDLKIQTLNATSSDNLSNQTIESLDNQFGILFAKSFEIS